MGNWSGGNTRLIIYLFSGLKTMADPKYDWDEGTRLSMVIEGLEEERRKFVDLRNPKDLNELREAISRANSYAISNPTLRLEKA
jgi:hypothetical protein